MNFKESLAEAKTSYQHTNIVRNDSIPKSEAERSEIDPIIFLLGPLVLVTTILLIGKTTAFFEKELGSFNAGLTTAICLELFMLSLSLLKEKTLMGELWRKGLLIGLFMLTFGSIAYNSISPKLNNLSETASLKSQIKAKRIQIQRVKESMGEFKSRGWIRNYKIQADRLPPLEAEYDELLKRKGSHNSIAVWYSIALALLLRFFLQVTNIYAGHKVGELFRESSIR